MESKRLGAAASALSCKGCIRVSKATNDGGWFDTRRDETIGGQTFMEDPSLGTAHHAVQARDDITRRKKGADVDFIG